MRILKWLLIGAGLVVMLATMAVWYWVSAFGCGMNTTGCHGFSLSMPWEDPELFGILGPFLLLGAVISGCGLLIGRHRT